MHCVPTCCHDAGCNCWSTTIVFSAIPWLATWLKPPRRFCCWFTICPSGKYSWWTGPLASKNVISMVFTLNIDIMAFFGCGSWLLFHCRFCYLVSGSYCNTQESSPMIIMLRMLRLWQICSRVSLQASTLLAYWSQDNSFGTIFALTFLMSKYSTKIFHTDSLSIFSISAMFLIVSLRSDHTKSLTHWMFKSRPDFGSSLTSFHPLQKHLSHSKAWACDIVASSAVTYHNFLFCPILCWFFKISVVLGWKVLVRLK